MTPWERRYQGPDAEAPAAADRRRTFRPLARSLRSDGPGHLSGQAADLFIERARRIAESLELGLAGAQGALLAKGERLRRVKPEG
jgi:hypothetical protein